jgi:3-methyladenine DNA glycosylase Tag
MTSFAEIIARAATWKGGEAALKRILTTTVPRPPAEIALTPDDRILAGMTRRIFCAGFSSKAIDDKWRAFKTCFDGFDPSACVFMSEEHFDRLLQDRGTVLNGAKIRSVQFNCMNRDPMRPEYEARVMTLHGRANAMRQDGSTPEAIARAMHTARRQLCQVFKKQTLEPQRTRIFDRTRAVYGDPLGPSVEYLRTQGKSWEDIIDSASRPGRPPLECSFSSEDREA